MSKAPTCTHIISGVKGNRPCTKDAVYIINDDQPVCAKHFHVNISRAMKAAAANEEVKFTFTSL